LIHMKIKHFLHLCILALLVTLTTGEISPKTFLLNKVKLVCTYRLTYRLDSTVAYSSQEKMRLTITDSLSEFVSLTKLKRDSVLSQVMARAQISPAGSPNAPSLLAAALQAPKTKFSFKIYKYYSNPNCVVYDNIGTKNFSYLESRFPSRWTLDPATSLIAGYKCQKATTSFGGRVYEAWFTREIPVSDGPYKFSGLPGLIVKIHDLQNSYDFELIGVNNASAQTAVTLPHNTATRVTKEAFFTSSKAAHIDAINRMTQTGFRFNNPEEAQRQHQEKLKRENNPLELRW
jgi:GLPGLI family protein